MGEDGEVRAGEQTSAKGRQPCGNNGYPRLQILLVIVLVLLIPDRQRRSLPDCLSAPMFSATPDPHDLRLIVPMVSKD